MDSTSWQVERAPDGDLAVVVGLYGALPLEVWADVVQQLRKIKQGLTIEVNIIKEYGIHTDESFEAVGILKWVALWRCNWCWERNILLIACWDKVHVYLVIIWGAMGSLKEQTWRGRRRSRSQLRVNSDLGPAHPVPTSRYPRNPRQQIRKTTVLADNNGKDERRQ
jgi:hypothetical protein